MPGDLNGWEIVALLLLALLIFGDKLPNVLADGVKMLRNLRNMARNATGDLSRELGTDIQLEDLHPKAFIRKHLLSEEDEDALRRPLRGVYDDLKDVADRANSDIVGTKASGPSPDGATPASAPAGSRRQLDDIT